MTAIADLIERLERRGVMLLAEDGQLKTRGSFPGSGGDLEALRVRKPEAVAFLEGRQAAQRRHETQARVRGLDLADRGQILTQAEGSAFAAVARGDFHTMLELERYVDRSPLFDRMITASADHSWTPLDARYLDYAESFDLGSEPLIDDIEFLSLRTPLVQARLTEADRIRLINKIAWIRFSGLLHGEQGALNLSASLVGLLKDQAALEFVANQTREEARHVTAFARYIKARWGRPAPCPPALREFLIEIVGSADVTKKIIGMQVMVEGLAMGILGSLYRKMRDPLGKRLLQLVMTDESAHHRFGKLWSDHTMPNLSIHERTRLELWTAHCLRDFIVKMNPPIELYLLEHDFGLDPAEVTAEMRALPDEVRSAAQARGVSEIFRVLTNILMGADLLSESSKTVYRAYLAVDDADVSDFGHDAIVADGLAYLRGVNEDLAAVS